ncbi:MAG: hypothetical protein ACN6NW_01955 [Acinetobacter amyesii]|uniref:hypothetical protein n=1 Tax=Acinetobacter amyesii TaxID=2942470 RepID=UPI003D0801B3
MTSYSIAEYKQMIGGAKPKRGTKRPKVESQKVPNEFEAKLALELKALKIDFEQEFKFHQSRKWRADFHLKGRMILIEVEGGIWSGGRHTRGKGYIGDMEKYNAATMLGYQVIRFSTEQVKSGLAIQQIEKMVGDLG